MTNPLMVALDHKDAANAVALAGELHGHVGAFKIGLGLLHRSDGPSTLAHLVDLGTPVFVDAKLHDIPTQVGRAAEQLGRSGARWVSVHASGGVEMIEAAVVGLHDGSAGAAGILGVSVLTSLDQASVCALGIETAIPDLVTRMATVLDEAGAEGVVCSPLEVEPVAGVARRLSIVTPGIRPSSVGVWDQRRVATPAEALAAGATWLVIGRAITGADDPMSATNEIVTNIQQYVAD